MGFFTVGNLITIGIVLLILFLFRQMDRNNRNIRLLRDYSEKLKKDLAVYVDEREKAVKDYGIALNVERDSARELMKHLQITSEELAEKAATVARIDSQIKTYEGSLSELDRMTARVQENMNRIRDESSFVENAGKRIGDAKAKLGELEKSFENLENRFERENAESLEKTGEALVAALKSTVSDLGAAAEITERQVEEHRREINKIEESRAANVARDIGHINDILRTAVEQAGKRADKMEEAALVSLREQAEERLRRLKTAEEEKLQQYHDSAKARVAEVQNHVKTIREEWRAERSDWETKDKAYRDERKKETQELNAVFTEARKRFGAEHAALEKRMNELSARADEILSTQETRLLRAAEEMKQKALEITGVKLEEYRHAQDAEFRRLESLADDSRKLDAELRHNMREVVDRVKEDFSRYERESADKRKAEAEKFLGAGAALKEEMAAVEKELASLKTSARENVSDKLKLFEDEFFADLSKRDSEIDQRILSWQESLDNRLVKISEEAEAGRVEMERGLGEEMRKRLASQDERLVSELEHLKAETGAFEEGIRAHMNTADDSVASLRERLDHSLEEAGKDAELLIRAEIGKHTLASSEIVKQYQRDLEGKIRETADLVQARSGELYGLVDASRAELDAARDGISGKLKELDGVIEDTRRRVRDLSAETDDRITSVRSSVEDAERHIREAVDQTKLLDRAEELKRDMERRVEDLRGDIDRLDQRRAEAAQLENDFIKIRRLEDDVNAKMTRFLSERRRIETMESDFNRLLQISRAVEEKLAQVSSSDDTLQGVQLGIRKLEEALETAEDKYQRVERKTQLLENTNEGIDRNFKALQESEKISAKIGGDLDRYAEDLETLKKSIVTLAAESDKAREAVERIDVLDDALEEIEERIKSMQRARQWVADAETRLDQLNKQAQTQARAIDAMVKGKKKSGPSVDLGEGAPPPQKKENVIALKRQGWTNEEIAKALKISLGEVELILEMAPHT